MWVGTEERKERGEKKTNSQREKNNNNKEKIRSQLQPVSPAQHLWSRGRRMKSLGAVWAKILSWGRES